MFFYEWFWVFELGFNFLNVQVHIRFVSYYNTVDTAIQGDFWVIQRTRGRFCMCLQLITCKSNKLLLKIPPKIIVLSMLLQ